MQNTTEDIRLRRALAEQIRRIGTPEALADAAAFEVQLHDQQMNILSQDSYWSAKGQLAPPPERIAPVGWTRGSEHLDELRRHAPGLAKFSNTEILQQLKPDESGFRAEIYLPDPTILGPGYKPVIVHKGSAGDVMQYNTEGRAELRDTTIEDFLANNFPQAVGLQTDYYDRAMRLAVDMASYGLDFEAAGHSLAGGMASGMAAVTGRNATTFNAAGLNPATAARFAEQNPGVQVYDVSHRIIAYQVKGEMLNDGLQNNVARWDERQREVLGGVLGDTAGLLRTVPQAQALLEAQINNPHDANKQLPVGERNTVHQFFDALASDDVDHLLQQLPLAAGQVRVLDRVKTWQDGQLVDRTDQLSLADATVLAMPVAEMLEPTLKGARIGGAFGQAGARLTDAAADVLHQVAADTPAAAHRLDQLASSTTGFQADTLKAGVHLAGERAASVRGVAGDIEAGLDHARGTASHHAATLAGGALHAASSIELLPDAIRQRLQQAGDDIDAAGKAALHDGQLRADHARTSADADAASIRAFGADRIDEISGVQHSLDRQRSQLIDAGGTAVSQTLDGAGNVLDRSAHDMPATGAISGARIGLEVAALKRVADAGDVMTPQGSLEYAGAIVLAPVSAARHDRPLGEAVQQAATSKGPLALAVDLDKTARLASHAASSGGEAFKRHLEADTLAPTFEAMVQSSETQLRAKYALPLHQTDVAIGDRDDPLVGVVRNAVKSAEAGLGKPWDDNSERLTASLALLARRQGFTAEDTLTVGFNHATASHHAGEFASLLRSGPHQSPDPAANRAHIATEAAIARPAQESLAELAQLDQARGQQPAQEHDVALLAASQQTEQQRQPGLVR